ncbi:hypothetical protein GCK72_025152 [Caenorhabditis remanei]|uniref:Uncharacterized protein n=1 Tax=Caenorhabditis remanei TaxID=31234 RepID=A0A6A5G1Z4_CAERE|nr:hypothetical protein GCK72_025152 [Caenorhabditis remanei]KAF1748685.1 hypothetical protein GCK72_025152 [Caenorhabditis remanei]
MGGADGAPNTSLAVTNNDRLYWRHTPIVSQCPNGVPNPVVVIQKEFLTETPRPHISKSQFVRKIFEHDWNHLVEVSIPGYEFYGLKEYVKAYPKQLDTFDFEFLIHGGKLLATRRMYVDRVTGARFSTGPVFKNCNIDVSMFSGLLKLAWSEMNKVVKNEEKEPNGLDVFGEIEVASGLSNTTKPVGIEMSVNKPGGYSPKNSEFPGLEEGQADKAPKVESVGNQQQSLKNYRTNQGCYKNFNNRQFNLWTQHYKQFVPHFRKFGQHHYNLNNQIDRVLQDDAGSFRKGNRRSFKKDDGAGMQSQSTITYQSVLHVEVPLAPTRTLESTVVSREGVYNNFQTTHGYRQWKRASHAPNNQVDSNSTGQ